MTSIPPVREFMTMTPVSIDRNQSLAQAERLMKDHGIRHLPVIEQDGTLMGVLSAREVQTISRLPDIDLARVPAHHIAHEEVFTVSPETPVDAVCATMAERRYGCAVVVHDRHVLGIFTTTDVCAALAALVRDRNAT
jgi:acetoin utilization protein AcuB